jgi:hypothetical protein
MVSKMRAVVALAISILFIVVLFAVEGNGSGSVKTVTSTATVTTITVSTIVSTTTKTAIPLSNGSDIGQTFNATLAKVSFLLPGGEYRYETQPSYFFKSGSVVSTRMPRAWLWRYPPPFGLAWRRRTLHNKNIARNEK